MTNSFRQGLFNRLNVKEEKIKKELENKEDQITYEKLEKAENLRSEIEGKTEITEEEWEKLDSEIEEL